ncbi:MAG: PAS domain-containing protein, partial [Proteobacteria bacterium]|nr:PAS domain-containing protein [Pseudomonadota bacterium]
MTAEIHHSPERPRYRPGVAAALVLGVAATLAVVLSLSVHLRSQERERAVHNWRARLEALADSRKRAVQRWLAERRSDAEVLAWDPDLIGLCAEGACPKGRDPLVLRAHLDNLKRYAGFLGAYLFTPSGEVLLAAEGGLPPDAAASVLARRAAREGRYLLHDLHVGEDGTPVIGFLSPVLDRVDPLQHPLESTVLGVTGLYLDPRNTLFPLVLGVPAPATTTSLEIYLVRRAPGGAEVLTPLRVPPAAARGQFVTPETLREAELAALESKETAGWFHDYRGRSVLAAVRWISEAGWGLVVKVDEEEALAGWRQEVLRQAGFLGAGLLCLLLGGVAVQRTWAGRHYRRLLGQVRDREERLRALAEGSDDVIFIKDPGGRFLLANPAASRVLGIDSEGIADRRSAELLPPHVAAVLEAHDRQALASGRPFHGEEIIPVGGEERTFLSARMPLMDAEGRVTGLAGVLRDITERKRNEETVTRWAQTLGALYRLARNLTLAEVDEAVLQAVLD